MKMYVRESLQPRGIFTAEAANNITSYQFCCSRANKIFFFYLFLSWRCPHFFKKRGHIFSLRRVVVVVVFLGWWWEIENYSQYLFFHGRRRYVLTIVIMAQLTCIVCVFASISHSLCACNMTDVVMWK